MQIMMILMIHQNIVVCLLFVGNTRAARDYTTAKPQKPRDFFHQKNSQGHIIDAF